MNLPASIPSGGQRLIINLRARGEDEVVFHNFEYHVQGACARIALRQNVSLSEALEPGAARQIERLAADGAQRPGMISRPDEVVVLPYLHLQGCDVISNHSAVDDTMLIIVRFRHVFGSIFDILNPAMPLRERLEDRVARHALDLLETVYVPLFDLSSYLDDVLAGRFGSDGKLMSALSSINERIKSMEMYRFMLIRHLEARDQPTADASSALEALGQPPHLIEQST